MVLRESVKNCAVQGPGKHFVGHLGHECRGKRVELGKPQGVVADALRGCPEIVRTVQVLADATWVNRIYNVPPNTVPCFEEEYVASRVGNIRAMVAPVSPAPTTT